MATLSRGATYGASETLTNTKLHNLVDLGSITNIVDADCSPSMNLADTKLADITSANKVKGTAIGNLASIPSGAGLIPTGNIPTLGASLVSLISIPNSSLVPITLSSWVDGLSLRNISSLPSGAGQAPWYSVVSSLASGSLPIFDGSSRLVGGIPGSARLVSRTTFSSATNTGDITINNNLYYLVMFDITALSGNDTFLLRFNNNTTAGAYKWIYRGFDYAATAFNGNGTVAQSSLQMTPLMSSIASAWNYSGLFFIYPQSSAASRGILVKGDFLGVPNGGDVGFVEFSGYWANTTTATSFRFLTNSSSTMSGTVYLYQLG